MSGARHISRGARLQWLLDAILFAGGLAAMLSGIYFLYLPRGGYQGGRNPLYAVRILLDRHTWNSLHIWSGVAMIGIAVIHLGVHWKWLLGMARRVGRELGGRGPALTRGGWLNLGINAAVAVCFTLTAVSGVYLLFLPGRHWAPDPSLLLSRRSWSLVHTWAAVGLVMALVAHLHMHWRWVAKTTARVLGSLGRSGRPARQGPTASELAG